MKTALNNSFASSALSHLLVLLLAIALLLPLAQAEDEDRSKNLNLTEAYKDLVEQLKKDMEETFPSVSTDADDENKTADQLLDEAKKLFFLQRSIDARSKLLRALKKAPNDFRPHMLLGTYYLSEVGHFRLAYSYAKKALELFEAQNGKDELALLETESWREHAKLLLLLSECQLNLDNYAEALATLDRFSKVYWDPGEAASRAWILMKLKRIEEGINVAKWGILRGASPDRTFNVLGILLSLLGNKDLSIAAFANAIKAEFQEGSANISTPLNNAGEIYREWFSDDLAKASWLHVLRLPDSCDHILPSLNLAILHMDELRLFQAERVLKDFASCFAQNPNRSDTEHRALLALGQGRILLRMGDSEKALVLLEKAIEETQWFGKIGATEADVRFATLITKAQALSARANELRDQQTRYFWQRLPLLSEALAKETQGWWLMRRAREVGLVELDDLEDLYVRHSDAMLEYPTLGDLLAGFPLSSLKARLARISRPEKRPFAQNYYLLYLSQGLLAAGHYQEADKILQELQKLWRPIDRLAQAMTLTLRIDALDHLRPVFGEQTSEELELTANLFQIAPSFVRQKNLRLPIAGIETTTSVSSKELDAHAEDITSRLLRSRFVQTPSKLFSAKHRLIIQVKALSAETAPTEYSQVSLAIQLLETSHNTIVANVSQIMPSSNIDTSQLVNSFIQQVFSHKADPPEENIPPVPILEGLGKNS